MLATGCITPALRGPLPADLPAPRALLDVPFYEQKAYECGPAALAMALSYSGVSVLPDQLAPQAYTPGRKGTLQSDMVGAARRNGRIPFPVQGMPALLHELANG